MGCYSSDALIKQKNRQAEWTLIKAENLSAMAMIMGVEYYQYPNEIIDQAWKTTLFNQFHDILAGTSIEKARNQAIDEFSFSIAQARNIIMDGVQGIVNQLDTRGEGFPLVIINPTGHQYKGLIQSDIYLPRANKKNIRLRDVNGEELAFCESNYQISSMDSRKSILFETELPPYSYKMIRVMEDGPDKYYADKIKVNGLFVKNKHYSIQFDEKTGCPKSIQIDQHELLDSAISIKVFDDYRGAWGVKHLEETTGEIFQVKTVEVIEETPLRTIVRSILNYNKSEICIDYFLERHSEAIKMRMTFHNLERHKQISLSIPFINQEPKVWNESHFCMEQKVENTNTEYYQHRFAYLQGKESLGFAILNSSNYGMIQNKNEYKLILVLNLT
jgi:alpha-mannosidase